MQVKTDTIIRTVCYGLAMANLILESLGKSPIPVTDEQIRTLITVGAAVVVSLWTFWKNNSFTSAAIQADEYMQKLKAEEE